MEGETWCSGSRFYDNVTTACICLVTEWKWVSLKKKKKKKKFFFFFFFFFFRETPTSPWVPFRAKFRPLGRLFRPSRSLAWSLYLNTYEWPIPKRESSFQTKHFICTATLWGGERMGRPILPPPPPPPFQNVLIFLFIFQSFSLCYSFTVSEDLWMTHSKEIIKFSNQKVYWLSPSKVFQPLYFILVNWFFKIVGWGKAGPIFL